MKAEIDALRTKVEDMVEVIAQLSASVRLLTSSSRGISQTERDRLVGAVSAVDSGSAGSPESLSWEETNLLIPFDEQDYSYLDDLFPEGDVGGKSELGVEGSSLVSEPAGPGEEVSSSSFDKQGGENLSLPLASAALYAFIASQVNTPGNLFSRRDSFNMESHGTTASGQMR